MKTFASLRSRRGAAFITTLVFTALLLAMSAAILTWSTAESRLNRVHSQRLEARNAAETLLEYGAARAVRQIQGATEYSANFCNPNSPTTTLALDPADLAELFAGTNIDTTTVEVVGKVTSRNTAGGYFIDDNDPRNAYTSLPRNVRGKDGELELLARASTLPDSSGRRQSIFLRKTYTIFDAPVLQYAAFYNMDLEVAPGPTFNIYGPVHTNANLWVSKQSGSSVNLSFWEAVTAVGYIRKGFKVQPIQAGGTRETPQGDPIRFIKPNGSFENLYGNWSPYNNVWRDQYMGGTTTERTAEFRAFTNATYGNASTQSSLQTSAHGILRRPLPGQLDNYVADPNPTDGIIAPSYRNVPRALIERPLYGTNVELIGQEVEMQKMSRKAGLYIIVNASGILKPNVQAPDGSIIAQLNHGEYRAYARNPSSTTMVPTYTEVKLPGQPAGSGSNTAHPWLTIPANAATPNVRPLIHVATSQMTDNRRFYSPDNNPAMAVTATHNPWLARAATNPYHPKRLNLVEVDMTVLRLAVDYTVNGSPRTMQFPYDANFGWNGTTVAGIVTVTLPPSFQITSNTDPRYRSTYRATIGQYGIDSNVTTAAGTGIARDGLYEHIDNRYAITNMLSTDWDGSMYIEVVDADFIDTAYTAAEAATAPIPLKADGTGQESWRRRKPGHRNSGVRLINGRGPIASAGPTRLANTTIPCSPGLTLTTNDALYILGHLNADGSVQTTSVAPTAAQLRGPSPDPLTVTDASSSGNNSSLFRDPEIISGAPTEQPLALLADAITILSQPVFNLRGTNTDGILDDAQTSGWNDSLSHIIIEPPKTSNVLDFTKWSPAWKTTPLSNNNQRDGFYLAPNSGNKWVLDTVVNTALRSPLEPFAGTLGIPNFFNPAAPYPGSPAIQVPTSDSRPAINIKFYGATTEISAGFIIGLSPSENNPADTTFTTSTGDGNNSGGLHNLPRFLETWNAACAIRGSMVVMFESKVAWEPFNLRVYGPPDRQWGFHNYFRNFYFSDDIPATRNIGITNNDDFELISRDTFITDRNAMWSYSFSTPP
jgi:hypothetical protein